MRRLVPILLLVLAACADEQPAVMRRAVLPAHLPPAGVLFEPLPEGDGASIAEQRCLNCHSADIIRQQRLTEAQWTGVVDKMARWGSGMQEDERAPLIAYLARHFGLANSFTPVETQPIEVVAR